MLVPKKMSTKKIAVYLAIIILMVGSTGAMLLQSQKPVGRKFLPDDKAARGDKFMPPEDAVPSGETASTMPAANQLPADKNMNQLSDASQIKNGSESDLSIFQSEKFKALKENVLIYQTQSSPGKRNPFAPD